MKPKLLCILHRSPPAHGAAKVGDFIGESKKLHDALECKFITIKSSETIGDIGKVNFKKLYLVIELYFKVLFALVSFRPSKIYFTASVNGAAFYRDILLSSLWKTYSFITYVEIFYHYHTKGVDKFINTSNSTLKLVNFFVRGVNIILLSPLLKQDIDKLDNYNSILYLSNGVEDHMKQIDFTNYLDIKYNNINTINILYLAHMMKDKGYLEALELANLNKNNNIHFHFAGSWKNQVNEKDFFHYIEEKKLKKSITFHGFVSGKEKEKLFEKAHILLYPSKNDAFPLTLLESFSYGVPVVTTNEGSIPFLVDDKSGVVVSDLEDLPIALEDTLENLINKETSYYCRKRYLDNFSLEQFEENLVNIINN